MAKKTMKSKSSESAVVTSREIKKLLDGAPVKRRKKRAARGEAAPSLAFRPKLHGGEFYLVPCLI